MNGADFERAIQAALSGAVTSDQGEVGKKEPLAITGDYEGLRCLTNDPVGGRGIEHPARSSEETPVAGQSGAESGARRTLTASSGANLPPDLARVVAAWDDLPDALKAAILSIVASTQGDGR